MLNVDWWCVCHINAANARRGIQSFQHVGRCASSTQTDATYETPRS